MEYIHVKLHDTHFEEYIREVENLKHISDSSPDVLIQLHKVCDMEQGGSTG